MAKLTKKQQKRREQKRQRKEGMRKKYEEYARKGVNKKSKRHVKKLRKLVADRDHSDGRCGNVACKKCFTEFNEKLEARDGEKQSRGRDGQVFSQAS